MVFRPATGSGLRSLDKLGMTNKNAPFCRHSEQSEESQTTRS
jgi:hypothetical protein